MVWIIYETATGFIKSVHDSEPNVGTGESKIEVDHIFNPYQRLEFWKYNGSDVVECTEAEIKLRKYGELYEIQDDVDEHLMDKDFRSINYKIELNSGVAYTPVFIIHEEGANVGHLEKTEYYRDYVDENNKGTLVLVVEESYVIDNSDPSLNHTAKPVLQRTKTWRHVRKSDGQLEDTVVKTKTKIYDTRRKQHIEGNRRRENVVEQLIDNVALAGFLSGTFTTVDDAKEKLVALQELHASAFTGWKNSGRGSLIDVVENDVITTWLSDTVVDSPQTQAACSWMIGMTFRSYIQEKLKGNIK